MTRERYNNYRRAISLIDLLEDGCVDADTKATLSACAEDLFLWRDGDPVPAEELSDAAAVIVTRLTTTGALSRTHATHLWRLITACGPIPVDTRARELVELAR